MPTAPGNGSQHGLLPLAGGAHKVGEISGGTREPLQYWLTNPQMPAWCAPRPAIATDGPFNVVRIE